MDSYLPTSTCKTALKMDTSCHSLLLFATKIRSHNNPGTWKYFTSAHRCGDVTTCEKCKNNYFNSLYSLWMNGTWNMNHTLIHYFKLYTGYVYMCTSFTIMSFIQVLILFEIFSSLFLPLSRFWIVCSVQACVRLFGISGFGLIFDISSYHLTCSVGFGFFNLTFHQSL